MNFLTKSLLATNIILCSLSISTINASAAVFNFTFGQKGFDNTLSPPFVGSGTLSFDGAAIVGSYSLASLSNLDINLSFTNGLSFNSGDLPSNLSTTGISIFDSGSGNLGLTFTGGVSEGGLRLRSYGPGLDADYLNFEPTNSINNRIGSYGGDGVNNIYYVDIYRKSFMNPDAHRLYSSVFFGNYNAVSAQQVPEPATILGSLTAFSFAVYSKHKSKKLLK
jgi:hypothetical protein